MKRIVFAFALLITSLSFASLTDGLVGYWPLDGDAKDYSGNGNDGVLHGVSFGNGRNGNTLAAQFGGNDYVSVPSSGNVSQILDFSVAGWIKMNRYESSSDGAKWCAFVSKGGENVRQFGVQFGVTTNSVPFYQLVSGDRLSYPGIQINSWTHIAVTRSGRNTALYMNGVRVASGTSKSYPERHSGALEIGRDTPGVIEYFHGAMNDVCLYNRALSGAEVSAIYNGGLKINKVVFNANAEDVEGNTPSLSVLSGTRGKLPANGFRRQSGYMFKGWVTNSVERAELAAAGVIDVDYTDEQEITIDSDTTLYAVWEEEPALPQTYTITFDANGGAGKMEDLLVNSDLVLPVLFPELSDSIDLPDPTGFIAPPSPSHKFLGWALFADVDGVNNPESLVETTSDLRNHFMQNDLPGNGIIPLFAIWRRTFTVQFEANGGLGTMPPQTFFDGKRQKLSRNAYDKGNNVFLGWAVSSNDAEKGIIKYFDEDEFPYDDSDNSDKTLHAVWTTSVTVLFYNQEDKTLKPTTLGDYMRWKVEGESVGVWHQQGEFKELEPGKYYKFLFDVTEMGWMAGPISSEKVVYVIGASAFNSSTLLAGESFQHTELVDVDVEGGAGPSVFFVCHAEKISGQVFDPSTVRIKLEYLGSNGEIPHPVCSGFLANEWYKLPWGIYNVSAETTDGKWVAHPIYRLNLTSGTDNIRQIALDFFYRDEGELSGIEIRLDPNAMGAKVDPNVLKVYAHDTWMQIPRLPTPKYTMHEFQGWWTEPKGGKKVEEGGRIDGIIQVLYAHWELKIIRITIDWLSSFPLIFNASNGDIVTAAAMTAANGCRTVGECYALGIDPEDPNDDFRITDFKVNDGKVVITVNHTVDGSGNSFTDRIRTLGKKSLVDADWVDITDIDQSEYRFFKVAVEIDDDDGGSGGDGWGDGGDINLDDFVIEQGVLQRYVGEAANVVIPSCVTNIGEAAFVGNTNLVSVMIPDSVMSIGDWAFYGCMGLTSITVPDSVTNVGDYAFGFCTELTTASLPVSLEGRLSDSVFCECPEELRIVYRSASADMRSINVNFTDGNALDGVNCAEELVGAEGYAVPCRVWDNVVGTNSVNRIRVYKESCGDLAGAADVSLEIAGSRGYWNCQDLAPSNSLLYAYVDDIVGSACPTLTASNIPFENCRVVIYASTDSPNAKFGHYTINGVNVTGNDSTFGTEHWGDAGPWYSAQPLAQGVNYVVSPVIALGKGGVLSIVTHNAQGATIVDNTRGTIAAIQIVETKETPVRRTVTFDLGEYGSRVGGGELVQMVAEGSAAVAPQVVVTNGLALIGWDADFSCVTNDLTVTARYAVDKYYGSSDAYGNALNPVLALAEGFAGLSNGWNVLNEEFRLNMSGNGVSADGKTLAIGDAGLELGFPRPFTNITVVVEYESVAAADGLRGLFSVETAEYKNRVGVAVDAGGTISGYYNTVYANETSVTSYSQGLTYGMTLPLDGNKTYLAFHYDRRRANSPGNGVSVYCISPGTSTRCYYGFGLKFEVDNVSGICVGGAYGGVYAPMTGMTIRSLAVFEGDIAGGALNLGDEGTAVIPDYSASSAN